MPTAAHRRHLAQWLETHGLTTDDADWKEDNGDMSWFSVPPIRRGNIEIVGVRLTPKGADPVERDVTDAPTITQTLKVTIPPAVALGLGAVLDAAALSLSVRYGLTVQQVRQRWELAGAIASGVSVNTTVDAGGALKIKTASKAKGA